MNSSSHETENFAEISRVGQFVWIATEVQAPIAEIPSQSLPKVRFAPLSPIRRWLDGWPIRSARTARLICRLIPARCPFERTIQLFGRTILHIPPLCKLNPFFGEFVGLRFRALCYLADICGEDVTPYC